MSTGVKTVVLLTFCDEGDNTQDALDLVSYLNMMTKWIPQNSAQVESAVRHHNARTIFLRFA